MSDISDSSSIGSEVADADAAALGLLTPGIPPPPWLRRRWPA